MRGLQEPGRRAKIHFVGEEKAGAPQRNIALFDGIDFIFGSGSVAISLAGFRVPASNFDGKLGLVAIGGEAAGGPCVLEPHRCRARRISAMR